MVEVAGIVTHRQQPDTAKGVVFVNLEDETGLLNVICTADVWRRFRKVARMSPALIVRGMLERYQGVINVVARSHRGAPAHRRRHGPLPRLPLTGLRCPSVVRIDWQLRDALRFDESEQSAPDPLARVRWEWIE